MRYSRQFQRLNLLLINVYMPYEDSDARTEEFSQILCLIEDLIDRYTNCHIVIGGDFNVDFSRDWVHTALLNSFCDNVGISPIVCHTLCNIDYSYNFNMSRFNVLDHFLLSGTLFDKCVESASVLHSTDNTSDHDPILLQLKLDACYIGQAERVFVPHISWVKASANDLVNYRINLSSYLSKISLPIEAILCANPMCHDCEHIAAINRYADVISKACLDAGENFIPHTTDRCAGKRIPGWSERVEPLRQKSLFWHGIWIDCGSRGVGRLLIVCAVQELPITMPSVRLRERRITLYGSGLQRRLLLTPLGIFGMRLRKYAIIKLSSVE